MNSLSAPVSRARSAARAWACSRGLINSNPGVAIAVQRNEGLNNIIPAGSTAPVLFRNDALLGPASFPETPVYPMSDVVTQDIRMFHPDIEIPYADSWTAGIQRKVSTNMAVEVRYVGTRSANRLDDAGLQRTDARREQLPQRVQVRAAQPAART